MPGSSCSVGSPGIPRPISGWRWDPAARRHGESLRWPGSGTRWPCRSMSTSSAVRPTPSSWRSRSPCRGGRARPAGGARGSSISPAPSGCATPRSGSAGIRTRLGRRAARLRTDRAVPQGSAGCAARRVRRVLSDRGGARAAAARLPQVCVEPGIIIDAKSGVSGAGKTPTERTHFSECHGSISAYGVFAHRHAAEIEQELGVPVTFVPHLVPLDRGILETIYARLRPGVDERGRRRGAARRLRRLAVRAADRQRTCPRSSTSRTRTSATSAGASSVRAAARDGVCIDNLVKGAAGQAIQNFNVVFGFDETTALN